ncbi:MAG: class I SAM-dependent methyltransferase [Planctomycetaceae bacterium]
MPDEFEILQQLRNIPELFEEIRGQSTTDLAIQSRLRRKYDAEIVRTALTLAQIREKAKAKFSKAEEMWFDGTGYEQATAELVAQHKARRFSGTVWDLCCGIGSDSIALADRCQVYAVDHQAANCLRTQWNAETYSVRQNLQPICADVTELNFQGSMLVHIDPDRRATGHGRAVRVEHYVPGVEFLQKLTQTTWGGAIKLGPASNFAGHFSDVEYELISLHGECKEATVWFGSLADPGQWRATALPSGESLAGNPLDAFAEQSPLGQYLYDPDPAIVRSGLVNLLCERNELMRLDDTEEYLTSDRKVESPFVRGFEVLAELPNNEKEIRKFFRGADVGSVEIKCRHIPINADQLRKRLSLNGTKPRVLIFARVGGKARAIIGRRNESST